MQHFTIFHYLDQPKRYAGATFIEIAIVGTIGLTAFVLEYLAVGLIISLVVFRLVRAISRSSKIAYIKRWVNFHLEDMKAGPKNSRRFFF